VRVTASTTSAGQTLSTQSDQLSVSTGVPSQGGFSLSVSTLNIEGWEIDGASTQVTARLADRFSNPVPNGTVVNFTSAGGSIGSTCTTVGGVCSTTLTGQNFRPTNGRVAILAYAIGEESFTDKNGNGWFDISPVTELVNLDGNPTDLPEAWLDVNENRVRDANEPFVDFNNNAAYDSGDGKFNGVSCNENIVGGSAAGSCGIAKSIHVRGQGVVVFSGSTPTSSWANSSGGTVSSIAFTPRCDPTVVSTTPFLVGQSQTVVFTARDVNGNALPAGTTIAFTTTNGTIPSSTAT
jgi:hypothetical protein